MNEVVWCAHCRREFPRAEFAVKRRDRRRLSTGERVLSATHRRCHMETEYGESQLTARGTMAAEVRA